VEGLIVSKADCRFVVDIFINLGSIITFDASTFVETLTVSAFAEVTDSIELALEGPPCPELLHPCNITTSNNNRQHIDFTFMMLPP
jgi:hypothetical protein